jgi:hypothetical protein
MRLACRLAGSRALQNMARSLGYHQQCLASLPLEAHPRSELKAVVDQLSTSLSTILCI